MGNRRNVLNEVDLQASCLKRSQGRFPPGPWPLDIDINGSNTMLHRLFGSILCSHLCGKGSAFSGALETLCAGAGPGDDISLWIGNGDDCIVESRLDVGNSHLNILLNLLFLYSLPFGHTSSFNLLEINLVIYSRWIS